jgi:hypothetical protein
MNSIRGSLRGDVRPTGTDVRLRLDSSVTVKALVIIEPAFALVAVWSASQLWLYLCLDIKLHMVGFAPGFTCAMGHGVELHKGDIQVADNLLFALR